MSFLYFMIYDLKQLLLNFFQRHLLHFLKYFPMEFQHIQLQLKIQNFKDYLSHKLFLQNNQNNLELNFKVQNYLHKPNPQNHHIHHKPHRAFFQPYIYQYLVFYSFQQFKTIIRLLIKKLINPNFQIYFHELDNPMEMLWNYLLHEKLSYRQMYCLNINRLVFYLYWFRNIINLIN